MTKRPNWPPTKGIKSNAIKMSQVKDQTVTAGKGTVSTTLGKQDEARRGECNENFSPRNFRMLHVK